MLKYAILCGSAPKDYRQKKLLDKYDSLIGTAAKDDFAEKVEAVCGEKEGFVQEEKIVLFPNGLSELLLETVLNNIIEEVSAGDGIDEATEDVDEVLLYFCTQKEADLNTELSDSACPGVEVVRLGEDEVRKEVIAYYTELAAQLGVRLRVVYETDGELVSEEELGWEKVEA